MNLIIYSIFWKRDRTKYLVKRVNFAMFPESFSRLSLSFSKKTEGGTFRSESIVDLRVRIYPDSMIVNEIRGEKGPVDARINARERRRSKGEREKDVESQEATKVQRVGATTRVVRRELNSDVTFQSGGLGGRGRRKERWRRSKVRSGR